MADINWDIRREPRKWTREEVHQRLYASPEKIEFKGGIFTSTEERLNVLGMLLENLGIDQVIEFGNIADWKAAIEARERRGSESMQLPPSGA